MSELFQQLKENLTEEQVEGIVQTGIVPSHLKSAEDKKYYILLCNNLITLESQVAEGCEINAETIIAIGRHNAFRKIKEYLDNDGEMGTDLIQSRVMVEGVDAARGLTLYNFIKRVCNREYPEEALDDEILEQYISSNREEQNVAMATGFGGNAGTIMNEEG